MADVDKKDSGKPASNDPLTELIAVLFVLFIVMTAINGITSSFSKSKLFASGWSGLTERGLILSTTVPVSSVLNPLGGKFVVTSNTANLYESPGERMIGSRKLGEKGEIIGGPVTIYNQKYWKVRFEDGEEGWIREDNIGYLESEPNLLVKILLFFWKVVSFYKHIVFILSLILLVWIVYLYKGIVRLRIEEGEKLYPKGIIPEEFSEEKMQNPQWEKIESYLSSQNESDWRHAIIEADVMLSDLLDTMFLPGDTIGEKLKAVERADFTTIDNAWEAHKVRNQIAHEGASFTLNQREAKRVIALYRTVFEEFQIVEKS